MYRTLAAFPVAIIMAAPAVAQEAQGYWEGTIQIGAMELPVGVDLEEDESGKLSGILDSPSQGAFGIPLGEVEQADDRLTIAVPKVDGRFEGVWNGESAVWEGSWSQSGQTFPLTLARGERPERPVKTDPTADLPNSWEIPSDEAIAAIIEDRLTDRPGAGMIVSVIEPDESRTVVVSPDGGPEFGEDTIFEIGSMTKVFTAILLAQMTLDGTVALDDPVAKYLPDGATMPERGGTQITLANLSRHNSGLPRLPENLSPANMFDPYADYTEQDLLAFLAGYELPRDIGAEVEYSNLGVGLLGYALARAEGSDYETLVKRRILDPLGMADTAIALNADQQARFAQGYDGFMRPTNAWDLSVLAGAGGMRSTVGDMTTFLEAALDPQSILAEPLALMVDGTDGETGTGKALGWALLDTPTGKIMWHSGGTGGFRSFMAIQPETGRADVVLTNAAADPSPQDIALHVLVGAKVATSGKVPDAPPTVGRVDTPVTLTAAQLDRVVGTYRFAPNMNVTVTRDGDQLSAAITGQGPLPIYPRAPLEFFYRAVNAEIVFTERDGAITGAVFTQDGMTTPLAKLD